MLLKTRMSGSVRPARASRNAFGKLPPVIVLVCSVAPRYAAVRFSCRSTLIDIGRGNVSAGEETFQMTMTVSEGEVLGLDARRPANAVARSSETAWIRVTLPR